MRRPLTKIRPPQKGTQTKTRTHIHRLRARRSRPRNPPRTHRDGRGCRRSRCGSEGSRNASSVGLSPPWACFSFFPNMQVLWVCLQITPKKTKWMVSFWCIFLSHPKKGTLKTNTPTLAALLCLFSDSCFYPQLGAKQL